jgi:putative membrane protein
MKTLQIIFICVVALEHFYFMILEMFLWTTPKGIKAFGLKSKEFANDTKVLAANQGLYNGFIATGLIYALISEQKLFVIFFLICIILAGVYGAYSTQKNKLFYIQSLPAIFTLILTV